MNSDHFWIHCNICANQFDNATEIFLLNCQHMLCKECMKHTQRGTMCPMHKYPIKFCTLKELPQKQKSYFQPDICRTLDEPVRMIKFQRDHQMHLFKLTENYCVKYEKLNHELLATKTRIEEMNKLHKNLIETRTKMIKKLKEIYIRQRSSSGQQRYSSFNNNSLNNTGSSVSALNNSYMNHTTPTQYTVRNSNSSKFPANTPSSASTLVGNFFLPTAPCFKSNAKDILKSYSSDLNTTILPSSQSSRTPCFNTNAKRSLSSFSSNSSQNGSNLQSSQSSRAPFFM